MLWVLFNLSRNPSAQQKLLEEINAVVAPDEEPCGEHIKSMPYLKACLKESMRYSESAGDGGGGGGHHRRHRSCYRTYTARNMQEAINKTAVTAALRA